MAVEKGKLVDMYRWMVRQRDFNGMVIREAAAGYIPDFVHLGQPGSRGIMDA